MSVHAFCAGCHDPIEPSDFLDAVVTHPHPVWSLIHALHPDPACIRRYVVNHPSYFPRPSIEGPTVAQVETGYAHVIETYGDTRGYGRLVPIWKAGS